MVKLFVTFISNPFRLIFFLGKTPRLLKVLLKYRKLDGVEEKEADNLGYYAIHYAAYFSKLENIKCLVEHNASFITKKDKKGATPAHLAVSGNSISSLNYLEELDAAVVHQLDNQGRSLLFYANSKEMLLHLLSRSFSLQSQDAQGQSILFSAIEFGNHEFAKVLIEEFDFSVSEIGHQGKSLLHTAAAFGNWQIISYLVSEKNFPVFCEDSQQRIPFHFAAYNGFTACVKYFLDIRPNFDFDRRDCEGRSALELASYSNHNDIIELLIDKYHDVVIQPAKDGRNPLHTYLVNIHDANIQYSTFTKLIYLFGVNSADNKGRTALHRAIYFRKVNAVQYLLDNQADVSFVDHKGVSSIMLAHKLKNKNLIKMLENHTRKNLPSVGAVSSLEQVNTSGAMDFVKIMTNETKYFSDLLTKTKKKMQQTKYYNDSPLLIDDLVANEEEEHKRFGELKTRLLINMLNSVRLLKRVELTSDQIKSLQEEVINRPVGEWQSYFSNRFN